MLYLCLYLYYKMIFEENYHVDVELTVAEIGNASIEIVVVVVVVVAVEV